MRRVDRALVTCEHGGNRVPRDYADLFAGRERLLASHRGFDAGAYALASAIAKRIGCTLIASDVTRLLVDLNRSVTNRSVFSEVTRRLPAAEREHILRRRYHPYRRKVERALRRMLAGDGVVVHLSVHTFAPVLRGVVRNADIGLLYDPSRPRERSFCSAWRHALAASLPTVCIRCNYPYRGTSDGLTTYLRRALRSARYLGIELEVNQALVADAPSDWRRLRDTLTATLATLVNAQHCRTV
jgi:predicted N-formylglutamate amidohydrolase